MEQYLKANGIPYARGGPASKRRGNAKQKALKQTRLPPTTAASPGSLKPRAPRRQQETAPVKQPFFKPVSDTASESSENEPGSLERSTGQSMAHHFAPVSDSESDDLTSTRPAARTKEGETAHLRGTSPRQHVSTIKEKRSRRSRQSKINFPTGGPQFLSSDPVDSEDEEFRGTQLAPSTQPRLPARQVSPPAAIDLSSGESTSEAEVKDLKAGNRGRRGKRQISISSDTGSEEELVTPLRRRQRFMPRRGSNSAAGSPPSSSAQRRSSQMTEAQHEARDLDHNLIKTSKHRSANTKKDNFRSNLEKLRRKKAGLPSSSDEGDDEDEEASEDYVDVDDNDNGEDWIEEDDAGDQAGLLDDLPEIFQQPRQPIEQFKIAVQWEILDLLMPQGGLEPDSYFKPAISWLRDRTVDGAQAAISSIWRRPFVRALRRGPELSGIETGNLGFYCDACGRTNRVATFVVKFMGARYDHATLEDLASDAESSEDDLNVDGDELSDAADERARKERILRAEWNLGINCYERTCVAHELFHLRKRLRQEVEDKLTSMGLFTAAKKLERSIMTKSQRIECANQVTEQLDNARFQQRLWTQYRATIEKNEDYIVDPNAGRKRK